MALSILYVGDDTPHKTSMHRAQALKRLGHSVRVVNPEPEHARTRVASSFHHRTGYRYLRRTARKRVLGLATEDFDLAWVDGGRALDRDVVRELRRRVGLVVNYNNDDPFGPLNGGHWRTFLAAVPEYDLLAVVRDENVTEGYERDARRVLRVWRSYDEEDHRPRQLSPADVQRWQADVLFVGTWMPERGPFLAELLDRGVPVTIFGPRWERAREWRRLKPAWRGGYLSGDDYAKAIQCAGVSLGLLARQNRDLHTQRSLEVPALGGLLCAERSSEHRELYSEDEEVVLWANATECADKCLALLGDAARRAAIADAGRTRVLNQPVSNEKVVARVLRTALGARV